MYKICWGKHNGNGLVERLLKEARPKKKEKKFTFVATSSDALRIASIKLNAGYEIIKIRANK